MKRKKRKTNSTALEIGNKEEKGVKKGIIFCS
jgi:hypothetical protein